MPRVLVLGLRVGAALALVAAAIGVLVASDADVTIASITLLLTVVGAATLGSVPGLAAAGSAAVGLTYYFIQPRHSFHIDRADDVFALLTFGAVSILVAATVARLNALRQRAEQLDAEAREQRVQADLDRTRAGFLTAVTHDLRTPIATIKTATGALIASEPMRGEDRAELLEAAHLASTHLEELVTKVLDLTRIRSGIRPEPTAIAPADLVQVALDRLRPVARARPVRVDVDPDLPAVQVDPVLIDHVLVNLIENALRHDTSGSDVVVTGRQTPTGVELSVIDHGPGIAAADQERAFDEFVRLHADTDRPGTGLGLPIARALAAANGGAVRYRVTPGGGATFVLSLPRAPVHEGATP